MAAVHQWLYLLAVATRVLVRAVARASTLSTSSQTGMVGSARMVRVPIITCRHL